MRYLLILCLTLLSFSGAHAQQDVDESATGAWFMYFYKFKFDDSLFGVQGDFQYRDWQGLSDREQLLLRSGLTYSPKDKPWLFTLGFANITNGAPGDADDPSTENRIYQEALFPHKVGKRLYFSHRFRYEQRFVENQDFRTRYRYNAFLNVPLNKPTLDTKALYLALYNEIFINGEKDIGAGNDVDFFDRNRAYVGLGYILNDISKVQFGWMKQTTATFEKNQLQFSLHQSF